MRLRRRLSRLPSGHGIGAAARKWRGEAADFSSARRWVRRRVLLVRASLSLFLGLEPVLLAGLVLLIGAFRDRLDAPVALLELRRLGLFAACADPLIRSDLICVGDVLDRKRVRQQKMALLRRPPFSDDAVAGHAGSVKQAEGRGNHRWVT